MKLKHLFFAFVVLFLYTNSFAATLTEKVIASETNKKSLQDIKEITNRIDDTYSDLYEKLKSGKKLTVFFDPAHGKDDSNRWTGGSATRRQSCTNRPEEYYSIIISREMYKRLKSNKFIDIKTTTDFLEVLEGKSEIYNNISFTETVANATKHNAFIIISEHLNNVSVIEKAAGIMNIPGIHVTRNLQGQRILKYVSNSYKGFLTLYNKLDASGFSNHYAVALKSSLVAKGLTANNWEHGAVGDDRFTYFVDFPVSVIYESGFISNPTEEKLLATQEYGALLADSQYTTLLESIKDIFKVDISGNRVKKTNDYKNRIDALELMKLSRIAVYYLKKADTERAVQTIRIMETNYSKPEYKSKIAYYSGIRKRIETTENFYKAGVTNLKKKNKTTAARYFKKAYYGLNASPIYSAYKNKYAKTLWSGGSTSSVSHKSRPYYHEIKETAVIPKAPKRRTIILSIEEGQTLEESIRAALDPNEANLKKLTASFKNASNSVLQKKKVWSKKQKKYITSWKRVNKKVYFTTGIYLVNIDDNLRVTKALKTSNVVLDHNKYQNQQYLKNSYFASSVMKKAL